MAAAPTPAELALQGGGVRALRIAVAGNAVVDIVVRGSAGRGEARYGWGEATHLVDEAVEGLLGGCGAAAAYALGRLGVDVTLTTNVGSDAFGRLLAAWLGEAGVTVAGTPAEAASAVHVVEVDEAGRRRSIYYTGPPVLWQAAADTPADWLLAAGYGGVGTKDAADLSELFRAVRQSGGRIAFDPGPWFARCLQRPPMLALWQQVDVLAGTEEELAHWLPGAAAGGATAADLARAATAAGAGMVAVKAGGRGAAYADRGGACGTVAAVPVPGGSSIGAGDTFDARLVAGLARGEGLATAVAAAVALATRAVQRGRGVLGAFEDGD